MGEQQKGQDIIIRSREKAEINGVLKVLSFDENEISLESVMGDMIIEGEGMHISNLDTDRGTVFLEGKLNGLYYISSEGGKKGFFGRLLG